MEKVITALKVLLENSIKTPGSSLSDIKKVYFWDPQQIPESCQPAITIQPISTEKVDRGPGYIENVFTIEMRLVYNQKQYYGKDQGPIVTPTQAMYDANFQEIQIDKTNHWLSVWDAIVLQASPSIFSGTHSVYEVLDVNTFTVKKTNAGAELTQSLSGVTYRTVNTENIFAVQDAIRKVEWVDPNTYEPLDDTIAWIVMKNNTLQYTSWSTTIIPVEYAKIETVEYGFSTNRWFPTYEIVVRMKAKRVRRRSQ